MILYIYSGISYCGFLKYIASLEAFEIATYSAFLLKGAMHFFLIVITDFEYPK